jgi:hypothetical protein
MSISTPLFICLYLKTSYRRILTTCTTDVFLVPLAALVAILMFLVCFAIRKRHPGEREESESR